MVRFIKKIRNFQFKGILMILGCFILIAAALFAERSGVQYQEKKRQISYIDKHNRKRGGRFIKKDMSGFA